MIESAHRLLLGEQPEPGVAADVASRHATTLGQDLRGKVSRYLVTRALDEELRKLPEGVMAIANIACIFRRMEGIVHVIASIALPDGSTWKDDVPDVAKMGFPDTVALLRWPIDQPFPPTESVTDFRAAIAKRGLALPELKT